MGHLRLHQLANACAALCLLVVSTLASETSERLSGEWLFLPLGSRDCSLLTGLRAEEIVCGTTPSAVVAARRRAEAADKGDSAAALPVWHPARFPHAGFDAFNPGRDVFGWYGRVLELPAELQGHDLILHLGVIDDADIAYVNGRPVGRMGDFDKRGSAWNRDREYRVPADLLRAGANTILVRVYDKWGLGGIMGVPALLLPLAPAKSAWQVASLGTTATAWPQTAGDPNQAGTLPEGFPDRWFSVPLTWQKSPLPDPDWDRRQPDSEVWGLYRLRFDSPVDGDRTDWTLDLGPVHDVCATFLNGRRIGLTGRFPHGAVPAFVETGRRTRYRLPTGALQATGNELVVVVYNREARGGLPATPGLLLDTAGIDSGVLDDTEAALRADVALDEATRAARQTGTTPAKRRGNPAFARELVEFDIALQSLAWRETERRLDSLRRLASDATDRARVLSASIRLDYLRSLEPGGQRLLFGDRARARQAKALRSLDELLRQHPAESVSQSAIQSVCAVLRAAEADPAAYRLVHDRFPGLAAARYVGADRATHGDWPLAYGREGYALAAMGRRISWYGGTGTSCKLAIPGERDVPRNWLDRPAMEIADPRALLMPGTWAPRLAALDPPAAAYFESPILPGETIRRASWWDDHGEQHAFDELGPDLLVSVRVPAGTHRLSFYCLDNDWRATLHPRQQSVLLLDAEGRLLNAAWTGTFGQGVYERFDVDGPRTVVARFLKHRSACVAVSGVFLDPAEDAIVPPEALRQFRADPSRPLRESYAAASRFLADVARLPAEELRPLLEPVLREATSPGLAPVRAWTLRLWRARGLPETPVSRHADARLHHLGMPPAAFGRRFPGICSSSKEGKELPRQSGTPGEENKP